jgi:hypothetical protein
MDERTRWLILIYRLPREPSRPRVAAWRKLKTLGAIYLQDGVAALPEDAVTREQLQWLQLNIREAGGEATLWEARPDTLAEEKRLVEAFRSSREESYRAITEAAGRIRRKAGMDTPLRGGGEALLKELGKLEKEFRAERRRDYFRSPLRKEASAALKAARRAVREGAAAGEEPEEHGAGAGS